MFWLLCHLSLGLDEARVRLERAVLVISATGAARVGWGQAALLTVAECAVRMFRGGVYLASDFNAPGSSARHRRSRFGDNFLTPDAAPKMRQIMRFPCMLEPRVGSPARCGAGRMDGSRLYRRATPVRAREMATRSAALSQAR